MHSKTWNCVLKRMNFVFKMIDFAAACGSCGNGVSRGDDAVRDRESYEKRYFQTNISFHRMQRRIEAAGKSVPK